MSETTFKITFVVLLIIYVLIRVPFEREYKQTEKIKTINSTREKSLIFLVLLGSTLVPILWSFTPFLDNFNIELPTWLRLLGVAISILSLFYFWWIHKTLGANWSPILEIRKGHELIKLGPYKRIRHPMYTQIWLWTIAQILIVSNLVAGFSGIIAWAILYFIRVPKEEKMMVEKFGNEYIEYMKQTGRILPKIYLQNKKYYGDKKPYYFKILCFSLLMQTFLFCTENQQNRSGINNLPNTQPDDCDNPDANIECCFVNMPESLESTMKIPCEDETAEKLIISGTIFKSDGKTPYPNVILYAYHTDSDGYYSKRGNETGVQKWHGYLHGWCKTDSEGHYTIKTIRPAPYPDLSTPAHIHSAIKKPDNSTLYINDFVFKDDPLVNEKYKSSFEREVGGTGIIELQKIDNVWIGQRDIILVD